MISEAILDVILIFALSVCFIPLTSLSILFFFLIFLTFCNLKIIYLKIVFQACIILVFSELPASEVWWLTLIFLYSFFFFFWYFYYACVTFCVVVSQSLDFFIFEDSLIYPLSERFLSSHVYSTNYLIKGIFYFCYIVFDL